MRHLYFVGKSDIGTGIGAQHFQIIYTGFLNAEEGFDRQQVRLATKILDKLESGGQLDKDGNYELKAEHQVHVALEDAEYDLLLKTLSNVKWRPGFSRHVNRALEFLEAAPNEEIVECKPLESSV